MGKVYLQECGNEAGKKYPCSKARITNTEGKLLDVVNAFKPQLKANRLKKPFDKRAGSWLAIDRSGVWRYREFLPAFKPYYTAITLMEGNTPVYPMAQCSSYSGVEQLFVKHAGLNPTGSIKDYGMATAITMAKLLGVKAVACASTGSMAASMSAYAARAGIPSLAILPQADINQSKLSQVLENRAITIVIDGDINAANAIAHEVCKRNGVYLVDSVNPFFIEGQKMVLIELLHQLNWESPDWIVMPGGNLGTCRAIGKGIVELKTAGFIDKMPRLAVIVAQDMNPLYKAFSTGDQTTQLDLALTRATALRINNPHHLDEALRYIKFTNGAVEMAAEDSIAMAKNYIGKDGLGADPSSAVTLARCKHLAATEVIKYNEKVVCLFTGHTLNDTDYTYEYHTDALFADTVRTVSREGKIRVPTFGIFNRLIRLPADAEKVIEFVTGKI